MRIVKNILHMMFNRATIMVLIIAAQFLWLALEATKLAHYTELMTYLFRIFSFCMILFVETREESTGYKVGWVVLICLIPIVGGLTYFFFGEKKPSKRLRVRINPVEKKHRAYLKQEYSLGEVNNGRLEQTLQYISDCGPYPAWTDTKVKYYSPADEVFEDLLDDLRKAEHYIFMEYFIIGSGYMWSRIHEILKEKAAAGVDVRVIYDDIGSLNRVPVTFARNLEKEGIKVIDFNPLRPIVSLVYNNRDHRKILVVDGHIAHSGGYNIADEYINRVRRFGHWKDSGVRVEGEAVWNFTVMFLNMWNAFRPTEDDYSEYRPHVHHPGHFEGDGIVQPFSDSPLDYENLSENVYLELLNQAENYVYIVTPYLIPDGEMMNALKLAAKRGVDVRITIPGIPDKKLTYRLSRSYYRPLLEAGVRIYEYTPGFVHAKSFVADDRIGVVGTINLDYRSLYLNFESGTLMVGCSALRDLEEDCTRMFEVSKEVQLKPHMTNIFGTMLDAMLRLLAPLF